MKNSIYYKIFVIFAVALLFVALLFTIIGHIQHENALKKAESTQLSAITYLISLYDKNRPPQDLKRFFSNFNMEIVNDKGKIIEITNQGREIFKQHTILGAFVSVEFKDALYLFIVNETFSVGFESLDTKNVTDPAWLGFFITFGLLIWLYYSVIKSLLPLKKLNNNIKKFASGNIDIIIQSPKDTNDEIAQLSFEFDRAVTKIRELLKSRQLFLRTIMHELKTPIGKGRIVCEMIEDERQKTRLISIFERLEILINEFAKVEQLLSKSYSLNIQECHLSLILEQARDILMMEKWDERVSVEIESDAILNVDIQIFALAIKNLIDNALKYADDRHVKIVANKDEICISNKGAALPISIEHYKQAFVRNKNERANGMGLGLYIIDKICELHGFKFEYFYANGEHNFIVAFGKDLKCDLQQTKNSNFNAQNNSKKDKNGETLEQKGATQ